MAVDDESYQPGQPIDLRPANRVAYWQSGPMGDFEWKAARVVARHSGARVTLQDDGTQEALPDIRVDHADRLVAYVEVGTDVHPDDGATWSWVAKATRDEAGRPLVKIPQTRAMAALQRDWQVTVGRASFKDLERELQALLLRLESATSTFDLAQRLEYVVNPDSTVKRLSDLGVVMLSSNVKAAQTALVRIYPDGIEGPAVIDWKPVLAWVSKTLESLDDARRKLTRTLAGERHFFLGVSFSSPGGAFFALSRDRMTLPSGAPALPPEITHLWLMNPFLDRCIAWFPDRGWFDPEDSWATD